MSTENPTKPTTTTRSSRVKDKEKSSNTNERLKVVVRRLPPNLPEQVFWQSVQPWVTDESVQWKQFYTGKLRKRVNKENIPSRAYIAFNTQDRLAEFSREYDGHLFRDKAGNESYALVEYAPYQKVPSDKKKADARNGTIEKDEDYISFIQSLAASAAATEPVTLESLIASTQPAPIPTTTPLLEALKAEKSAHNDKEAILRNHPHYKEIAKRKEEPKNKTAAATSQKPSAPPGKKGKKGANAAAAAAQKSSVQDQGTAAATSKSGPPPNAPKAPRAQLQKQQQQQAAKSQPTLPSSSSVTTAENSGNVTSGTSTPQSGSGGRRSRPVIGVASRQFEAALSGVAGERRGKRGDKEKNASNKAGGDATASSGNPSSGGPSTVSSPKRDRSSRKKEEQAPPKVPSILQRIDDVAPPAPAPSVSAPVPSVPAPARTSEGGPIPTGGGRGKGGRGRGRGRGRGGAPPSSRGAG